MGSPSIRRIERLNYVLGGLLVVGGALTQPRDIALGLAVGVVLTSANFYVLRKLVVKWTDDAAAGRSGHSAAMLMPKMIGLMGAVVACLAFLPINAVAFVVGYSLFLLSIVVEVVISVVTHPEPSESDHG